MKLGVRWYAPGELGEVLPALRTIRLPPLDETVRPDFPIRRFNVRFGVHGHELAMWAMRLGVRDPYGIQVAHGIDDMTHRDEIFARHPDWFALYGGNRHNQPHHWFAPRFESATHPNSSRIALHNYISILSRWLEMTSAGVVFSHFFCVFYVFFRSASCCRSAAGPLAEHVPLELTAGE